MTDYENHSRTNGDGELRRTLADRINRLNPVIHAELVGAYGGLFVIDNEAVWKGNKLYTVFEEPLHDGEHYKAEGIDEDGSRCTLFWSVDPRGENGWTEPAFVQMDEKVIINEDGEVVFVKS